MRRRQILGCILIMESIRFAAELNVACEKTWRQAFWPEQLEAGVTVSWGKYFVKEPLILVQPCN